MADLRETVYTLKELGLIDSVKATVKAIIRQIVTNDDARKLIEQEVDAMEITEGVVLD